MVRDDDPGRSPAETLRRRYADLLADYGVDAEREGDLILLTGEADAGPCPGVIECRDLETGAAVRGDACPAVLVELGYGLPFDPVPADRLAEVALLIGCINPDLGLGHFECDPLDGGLSFQAAWLAPPGGLEDGLSMAPLLEGINVIDDHAGAIAAVLDGAAAGHVFVQRVLAARDGAPDDDPDDPLPDAARARLLAWLEQAGEVYRRADDKARLAALGPLVRRVFAA